MSFRELAKSKRLKILKTSDGIVLFLCAKYHWLIIPELGSAGTRVLCPAIGITNGIESPRVLKISYQ